MDGCVRSICPFKSYKQTKRTLAFVLSSKYLMTFSAIILPVLVLRAPATTSRRNSYASFFISAIRISVSSRSDCAQPKEKKKKRENPTSEQFEKSSLKVCFVVVGGGSRTRSCSRNFSESSCVFSNSSFTSFSSRLAINRRWLMVSFKWGLPLSEGVALIRRRYCSYSAFSRLIALFVAVMSFSVFSSGSTVGGRSFVVMCEWGRLFGAVGQQRG